ncbi:MAG: DsbA family protein, partial [Betaproteobacteria bacterium]
MLNLVYFADPMCSWCYGFGPQLATLLERVSGRQPVNLELVMGGLRAYNTVVMDDTSKTVLLEHWTHVREASGLPFGDAAIHAHGFVYDTEPACRAVICARLLDGRVAL